MKEAVRKIIDTLTQEDSHGAFQMLLERYNKCIAAGVDYFEGDSSFMCVLSIKVFIRLKTYSMILVVYCATGKPVKTTKKKFPIDGKIIFYLSFHYSETVWYI